MRHTTDLPVLKERIPVGGSTDRSGCRIRRAFDCLENAYHPPTEPASDWFCGNSVRNTMARLILRSAIFLDGNIQLSTGDLPVTIGRSHRADITINDLLLSRIHAELRLSETGGFELVDRESTNLTIVNDHDIDRVLLKTGDRILLGDTELHVEIDMPEVDLHERTTREIPNIKPPQQ